MKQVIGQILANKVVKAALITTLGDIIHLYAKALVNVMKKKIESASVQHVEVKNDKGDKIHAELVD